MSRSYIFCEGKRDKRFLKRLIQEKKKVPQYMRSNLESLMIYFEKNALMVWRWLNAADMKSCSNRLQEDLGI
jgi:hypothetical protein